MHARRGTGNATLLLVMEWPERFFSIVDPGTHAGGYTNACFWLSVVIGWSKLEPMDYHEPTLQTLQCQISQLQSQIDDVFRVNDKKTALGVITKVLREYMAGTDGYMRKPEVKQMMLPASAWAQTTKLGTEASQVNLSAYYDAWLMKVRNCEFADELVVAATAKAFRLTIRCVP